MCELHAVNYNVKAIMKEAITMYAKIELSYYSWLSIITQTRLRKKLCLHVV